VWICESGRLGLVIAALGFSSQVGPSQFVLVALVAALLTTVPFTPGGVGLVQFGVTTALIIVAGISKTSALSIALLDGSISYASLLVIGFIVFALVNFLMSREAAAAARGLPGDRERRDDGRPATRSAV
jgi:uncharacterized protein (TIRG00374 family)